MIYLNGWRGLFPLNSGDILYSFKTVGYVRQNEVCNYFASYGHFYNRNVCVETYGNQTPAVSELTSLVTGRNLQLSHRATKTLQNPIAIKACQRWIHQSIPPQIGNYQIEGHYSFL